MPEEQKREWKSGDEYVDDKLAGVTAVLTRAGYDKEYRARLLSRDPATVKKAFAEEGSFDLPPDFRIECFERAGADAASTDNTVMLVLPKEYQLDAGTDPMQADSRDYWQCTYLPYRAKE